MSEQEARNRWQDEYDAGTIAHHIAQAADLDDKIRRARQHHCDTCSCENLPEHWDWD